MNADSIVLYYIGGLCLLTLAFAPLFLLLQIARDVRAIRKHHDRMYNASR